MWPPSMAPQKKGTHNFVSWTSALSVLAAYIYRLEENYVGFLNTK
jgi:hypothetical protein